MGRKKIIDESDYKSIKKYNFQFIDKPYKLFTDRECFDYLMKWNLDKSIKILSYSFDDEFGICDEERLIMNLFQCGEVLQALNCPSFLEQPEANHETSSTIEVEEVPCTVLSMEFFDRIYDCRIVLEDGTIRKCFEEYIDGVMVADELRNLLMVEESENYTVFEEERDEFIFRLFKHLCIGGALNQYEDNINPYLYMTKTFYRDIVCVRKTGIYKTTKIISKVFNVVCKKHQEPLIPSSKLNDQDFLYLVLNPTLKNLTIISNVW